MNFPLVAFTGLAGAGKSTAANALAEQLGFSCISFADPLRRMLGGLGITHEQMSAGKNVPIEWLDGKTPRQLMQTLGTEWGRNMIHTEIWTRRAAQQALTLYKSGYPGVVFDDCRFDNEAELIRGLGGLVIRIDREGLRAMNHASEAGVSEALVTATVQNQWEEEVFARVVVKVIQHLLPTPKPETTTLFERITTLTQMVEDVACGTGLTCPSCEKSMPCMCEHKGKK